MGKLSQPAFKLPHHILCDGKYSAIATITGAIFYCYNMIINFTCTDKNNVTTCTDEMSQLYKE